MYQEFKEKFDRDVATSGAVCDSELIHIEGDHAAAVWLHRFEGDDYIMSSEWIHTSHFSWILLDCHASHFECGDVDELIQLAFEECVTGLQNKVLGGQPC